MLIKNPFLKILISFLVGLILGILIFQHFIFKDFLSHNQAFTKIKILPKIKKNEKEFFLPETLKKKVKVDLSKQKMILFGNGKKLGEFSISSGKKESPTPTGKFRVINKAPMIYSKITDCWLPFWVGFLKDYGFHEIPICEEKRKGEKEIGKAASLGCIRLKVGEAEKFYQWVEIGTEIEIY
jgi:hypothetical protein